MAEARFVDATYLELVQPSPGESVDLLRAYRDAAREDAAALQVEVLRRIERPNQFIVLAAAASEPPLDAHRSAGPFVRLTERLAPLLAAPPDTRQHQALAVAAAANAGPNAITAVTHVDVVPQHKDEAVDALERLATDSRKHAGNVRFDVWQQIDRPNHFTMVETWSSRRSFNAHTAAEETRAFRAQLATMTGALYDERLFQVLG